jgi:hypothetical protein
MKASLSRLLVRLYPRPWRERYGREFETVLQEGRVDFRALTNVIWSAFCERLFPAVTNPGDLQMIQNTSRSRFQSWSARAPWAMFGLAPIVLLAATYLVAAFILWSGWKIFLPGTITPFVRVDGFAMIYFGIGRLLYFSAPVLVGWVLVIVATRQRLKSAWPAFGLVAVAVLGAAVQVRAHRTQGIAHVSMHLALGNSIPEVGSSLFHALMFLLLASAPYAIWRVRRFQPSPLSND